MLDKTKHVILSCNAMQGQGPLDTQEGAGSRPTVPTTSSLVTA